MQNPSQNPAAPSAPRFIPTPPIIRRTGKIGRLPLAIRDELNRRLQNGEPATHLVDWLNAQPEAQSILQQHFAGRPINDQNLSEWKQGGFQDWLRSEEAQAWARDAFHDAKELALDSTAPSPADSLSSIMAMALAFCLKEYMDASYDTEEKRSAIRGIVREINALRGRDHAVARMRMERGHFGSQRAREERWAQIVAATLSPSPSSTPPSNSEPRDGATPGEKPTTDLDNLADLVVEILASENSLDAGALRQPSTTSPREPQGAAPASILHPASPHPSSKIARPSPLTGAIQPTPIPATRILIPEPESIQFKPVQGISSQFNLAELQVQPAA